MSVDSRLRFNFSIFSFSITIFKAKGPDFIRKAIFSGGLRPFAPGWLRPCTRPLKLNDHRKSYNKQLSNLVEIAPFYGIGPSSKLVGFSVHQVFSFVLSSEQTIT